jgi:TusA-related sulfurtransferase
LIQQFFQLCQVNVICFDSNFGGLMDFHSPTHANSESVVMISITQDLDAVNLNHGCGEIAHSSSYLDDVACELEAINSSLKQCSLIGELQTITTSSGLVAGILSGTRTCPFRYRAFKKEFKKLTLGQNIEVILETKSAVEVVIQSILKDHHPTTLELLYASYCDKYPNSRVSQTKLQGSYYGISSQFYCNKK